MLYANGCSFTNDNHVHLKLDQPLYAEILANRLGISCMNNAFPGSCNRRIIRTTIRDCVSNNFGPETFVLVQLTFLERTEKPYQIAKHNAWKKTHRTAEWELHESVKLDDPDNRPYSENFLRHFDLKAELLNLATDLVMMTGFLQYRNIPYYVFFYPNLSGQCPDNDWTQNEPLLQHLAQDRNVANLFGMSFFELVDAQTHCYDGSHLNALGHIVAADRLQELIHFPNQCN